MIRKTTVEKVRAFHRFYIPFMNLLGNHYLGSEYSVTEARVFFEIYHREGCNAAYIARVMNIDKSYLSRILKAHEKKGYLFKKPSDADGRSYALFLTEAGKQRARQLIKASNNEIENILQNLSEQEEQILTDAIDAIMNVLNKQEE